tara:strand:- start:4733 stop:5365 length:633 start_codon:yes stop_codon:yes gene_type:complete
MTIFEQAWSIVKMPIVEPIPGVKVGYRAGGGLDQSNIDPNQVVFGGNQIDQEIGNIPYASSADSRMAMMTPNEYFDAIAPYTRSPLQGGRDDKYRWTPRATSQENIARMIEGIKEGKMIGAPTLSYGGKGEYSERKTNDDAWGYAGMQEGGHRMEALRQMGHGDTPIPVLQQRNFHVGIEPRRPPARTERDEELERLLSQIRRRRWRRRK